MLKKKQRRRRHVEAAEKDADGCLTGDWEQAEASKEQSKKFVLDLAWPEITHIAFSP